MIVTSHKCYSRPGASPEIDLTSRSTGTDLSPRSTGIGCVTRRGACALRCRLGMVRHASVLSGSKSVKTRSSRMSSAWPPTPDRRPNEWDVGIPMISTPQKRARIRKKPTLGPKRSLTQIASVRRSKPLLYPSLELHLIGDGEKAAC